MNKKMIGAMIACLCLAVCFSVGMTTAKADGNGPTPTPRVCSHPLCWGA